MSRVGVVVPSVKDMTRPSRFGAVPPIQESGEPDSLPHASESRRSEACQSVQEGSRADPSVALSTQQLRCRRPRTRSNDHGLRTTLRKHFSRGLPNQLNHTRAQNIGETTGGLPITDLFGNRGNSSLDLRHSVDATIGQDLPIGGDKPLPGETSGVPDQFVGGWKINGVMTLADGHWFSPYWPNTLNICEGTRPDRVADGQPPDNQQTIQRWFDGAKAVVALGSRQWGNSGCNLLHGPGTKLANVSVHKSFRVGEGKRLQFRAEFFDVTNTPQFNNPASNIRSPAVGRITGGGMAVAKRCGLAGKTAGNCERTGRRHIRARAKTIMPHARICGAHDISVKPELRPGLPSSPQSEDLRGSAILVDRVCNAIL